MRPTQSVSMVSTKNLKVDTMEDIKRCLAQAAQ